ncbi:Hect domain and RLD 4, variant [Aphelenchoides fujianensis]|nr:Hect domain and RLD 4, variant [Aphelenchoides fujianensis]
MYGDFLGLTNSISPKPYNFYSNQMKQQLYVFGDCADGKFGALRGDEDTACATRPTPFAIKTDGGLSDPLVQFCCGERHSIALTASGQVFSCGANDQGQLGRETTDVIGKVDFRKSVRIVQIAAGQAHNLAVADDGRLFAWGSNQYLSCGLPATQSVVPTPTRVKEISQVCQAACGNLSSCVLLETNKVFVFGWYISEAIKPLEVELLNPVPIRQIAAGGDHFAVVSSGGSVLCWGRNDFCQTSVVDKSEVRTPVAVAGVSNVVAIALGSNHTIVLVQGRPRVSVGARTTAASWATATRRSRCTRPTWWSTSCTSRCGRSPPAAPTRWRSPPTGCGPSASTRRGSWAWARSKTPTSRPPPISRTAALLSANWDQSVVFCGDKPGIPHTRVPRSLFLPRAERSDGERRAHRRQIPPRVHLLVASGCVNGSFLLDRQHPECSLTNSGLSMDDVMKSFALIEEAKEHESYAESSSRFVEFYDALFSKNRESFVCDELRFFMILPFFHSMSAPTEQTARVLIAPFVQLLARAVALHGPTIRTWFLLLDSRHFNRIVQTLMNYVQWLFQKDDKNHDPFVAPLNVLSELCQVNKISNRIPYTKFHLPALSSKQAPEEFARFGTPMPRGNFFWSQYPFVMNAEAKSAILEADSAIRMRLAVIRTPMAQLLPFINPDDSFLTFTIRRDHIVEDTYEHMMHLAGKNDVNKPLRVTFVGEEADDRGGVRKEYFMLLFEQLLQPTYGMFLSNEESHFVWFSGAIDDLGGFEMIGMLVALAIYNMVLPLRLEDFSEFSPEEGRSLENLLEYDQDDLEDVFCLNFVVNMEIFGHVRQIPLVENGENVPVTQANKAEFVEKYVQMKMEKGIDGAIANQIQAFIRGFHRVLNKDVLQFFQPRELQGDDRRKPGYKGEYHARHPVIEVFWECFFELSTEQKKKFLLFLSGTDRVPLRGMKEVPLIIQPMPEELIPVAHTCFNLLDLPKITDKETMKKKLLICLEHTQGFTLA